MQVMSFHFVSYQDPFDPDTNINAGCNYLYNCFINLQDFKLAVAAYNAGLQAVVDSKGIPPYPETISYVSIVGQNMLSYLHLDRNEIYTNPLLPNEHASLTNTYREAYGNALGVSQELANRIRKFKKANGDIN